MTYIIANGYDFNHDIYELVRTFYPDEEIQNIEDIDTYNKGNLLTISLIENEYGFICITKLYFDDVLISENTENLNDIFINRSWEKTINVGVKKSIFKTLIKVTDKKFPWGILTGIRPTKIVHELIEKNTPIEIINEILVNQYMLSDEKARLLIEIAKRQSKYLYPIDKSKYSLYIGIPFCPTRCIYCSFPAVPIKRCSKIVDSYIDNLMYEIKNIKYFMKDKTINTVYIGGGTPTSISVDQLKRIIAGVYKNFGYDNIKEFTVEAGRPDTLNYDMLKMFKEMRINRISINPQSMNDKTLRLIGRDHKASDIVDSFNMAKEIGIENINMDLIVGLPGEGLKEVENTLKIIGQLSPENLTVHTLSIKRGSNVKNNLDLYKLEEQKVIENMLTAISDFTKKNNYKPYYLYRQKNILGNFENIGYSKEGLECIYNISIMEEKETIIAAGVGSTSKIYYPEENRLERIFNFRDINEYINRIDVVIDRKRKLLLDT